MRAAVTMTMLVLASACFLERGTAPVPQPQKSALSKCYADGCAQPLFVVDGKRLSESRIDLNPSEIETVEVFKGEAAIRQYGEEGRNGVVVITTKRGSRDKTLEKT